MGASATIFSMSSLLFIPPHHLTDLPPRARAPGRLGSLVNALDNIQEVIKKLTLVTARGIVRLRHLPFPSRIHILGLFIFNL